MTKGTTLAERLLLSASDLAKLCGVDRQRVPGLVRAGVLPPPLPRQGLGKAWWSATQVEEHLRRQAAEAEGRQQPAPD
jgi:hypothetical protein